jgi:Domain of unknown function (DUF4340)
MSQRGLLGLIAALVVLAVIVVVTQHSGAPSSSAGAKFVPDLQAALNDIDKVTIVKAGSAAVATLERQPDGWVVAEREGYPADVGKLRKNLVALAEASILEEKTANPGNYERLGVQDIDKDSAKGVAVSLAAANRQLPTLIIGNADGTKYRYVRRAGAAQSFLIDRDPDFPRNTPQWLAPTIVDVRSDRVQKVVIQHKDGETVTIEKPDRKATNFDVPGVPAGRELLYPGVANVIANSLRELNLQDVAMADSAAATQPTVHVEFLTFDGLVIDVDGSKDGDKSWITLAAKFDPDQAKRFPPEPAATTDAKSGTGDQAKPSGAEASTPEADAQASKPASTPDVGKEAEELNRRVGKWRYQIATFQYDQMTRRMSDLLKPKEEPKKETKK